MIYSCLAKDVSVLFLYWLHVVTIVIICFSSSLARSLYYTTYVEPAWEHLLFSQLSANKVPVYRRFSLYCYVTRSGNGLKRFQ